MKFERRAARAARQAEPAPADISATDPATQIGRYVHSLDWGRVRATAQRAAETGALTHEQIDSAIDAALPDGKAAMKLPLPQLLAVASAASPARAAEYQPLIQQHFAAASPKVREVLGQHLQEMGMNPPQQEIAQ